MLVRGYKGTFPKLGRRVFIAENATLIGNVEIGDDSSVWYGTVIRGDVNSIRIGARTNIQDNSMLHVTRDKHAVLVEDEVTFGHGVIAHGCTVRRGCLIGIGSRLLDGSVIGEHSLVAAGSLVTEGMQIPPRSLVMGAPAKIKRALTEEELAWVDTFHKNYLGYKETYLAEPAAEFRDNE